MPQPTGQPTVLIVDDHHLLRRGLRRALEPAYQVTGEASDGHQAVALALEQRPDIVLMDVHLPSLGGVEAAQRIREQLPGISIIMMSASDADEDILGSVRAGASGYMVKGERPEALQAAIREVVDGHAYLSPPVAKRVLSALNSRAEVLISGFGALGPRELLVLRLIGEGYRNREIAQRLYVSERTVAGDVASIYRKLDLSDRTQAVRYAIAHRLSEVPTSE